MAANPYAGVAEPVDSYAGIAEPVAQTAPSAEAPASPYAGVAEPENTPAQSPQASQTPTAAQEDAQYGTITAYHPSVSDSVKKVYDALFNAIPTQPRHEPGVLPQWSDVPDALIGGPIRTMVQPGGIAAIATGLAGPAVAAKALGVAFGAQGAYQTIKNAPTTWGTLTDPNATGPEQALAVGNEAINAAMGAAGFASGVSMVRGFRGTPEVAEPIQSTTTEPPILPTTVKPQRSQLQALTPESRNLSHSLPQQ